MIIHLVLLAIALLVTGSLATGLCRGHDRLALVVGTAAAVAASVLGLGSALAVLLGGAAPGPLAASWAAPVGVLSVGIDPLSAFFLVCVFTVSGLSAVYGAGYLRPATPGGRVAAAVGFFDALVAAMALVVIAKDGVLFLAAWEVMSVASFFLVTFESDREEVRSAGLTYLVASHASVVVLILFFALLGRQAGSFSFDAILAKGVPVHTSVLFVLALVGFGAKAGFWPVHIWLPDAHPAAPSHVSAVMSG
jgi:formate hydrogenlyase subunit 3/multisubunit Na+/H+ antiporter MnhD subunit